MQLREAGTYITYDSHIFQIFMYILGVGGGSAGGCRAHAQLFCRRRILTTFSPPLPPPTPPSLRRCYIILCISSFYRVVTSTDYKYSNLINVRVVFLLIPNKFKFNLRALKVFRNRTKTTVFREVYDCM